MIVRGDSIVSFLEGKSEDYRGRTFASMLGWSDRELESCHDQVQWIFPLHEESRHANTYPVLTKDVVEKARGSNEVKCNLVKAKHMFERFLGVGECDDPDIQRRWCRDRNHNLLRVTRIIRSLRLLGLEDDARDFHAKVYAVGQRLGVNKTTLGYWDRALKDDVWGTLL